MALSKPVTDLKLFSCPLCVETLKSPKILPCLHTFCEKCIQEYILNLGRNKEETLPQFSCPVCRSVVKPENTGAKPSEWASSFQTNNSIAAMMAIDGKTKERECDTCKRHNQEAVAKFWCKECAATMCNDCLTKHNWIPILDTHNITNITDFVKSTNGIDLCVIRETCLKHINKPIHSFCVEHDELCCLSCVILDHRGCKEIKTVDDLTDTETIKVKQETLMKLKDAATQLLESKKESLQHFESEASETEESAAKFVKSLKCKLDQLFETFVKELNTYRDEKTTDIEIRIRLLEQLICGLEHWITTTEIVKESGSKSQLLVHLDSIKQHLKVSVSEIVTVCENDTKTNLKFKNEEKLEAVASSEHIGVFSADEKKLPDEFYDIRKSSEEFGLNFSPTFDTLTVTKIKTIQRSKSDFRCGVCIDDKYFIIGDNCGSSKDKRALHLLNKIDGTIISTVEFSHENNIKRFSYDAQRGYIFISCYSLGLFRAIFDDLSIQKPLRLTFNKDFVGGSFCYHDSMYIAVNGAVKTFTVTAGLHTIKEMDVCFITNTRSGLNSLCIQNGEFIYTTKDKEVKRAAIDGREIFNYKDDVLKTPECIAVLPSGLILICDRHDNGSLHLLSADGKQRKTLLGGFDKIENPWDIWLDTDSKKVFIAGGEYVEVYLISGV